MRESQKLRGISALALTSVNPSPSTSSSMSSISIAGYNLSATFSVFQCASSTSCTPISSVSLSQGSVAHFDTNATAFYFSTTFIVGQVYNYVIHFADGQSISGSLVAQEPGPLPVSPDYGVQTSSSSSVCTIAPHSTTISWTVN